ncbi:MAG: winged helix-turn-helix domain-containing protein [Rhizomicrobium sp.]
MNKLPRNLGASRPIDIGAEPDFLLGGLSVHPSTREASIGDGRETVEPRVMQVLVALVRADGGVVSRDRLIEQCWGGRLVGDDAINSSVAKVRALAALTVPPAFEIETIPRVGYRLRAHAEAQKRVEILVHAPAAEAKRLPWRSIAAVAIAVAILSVAVAAFVFLKPLFAPRPREWVVAESRMSFINTPLTERSPTFSPDGTMIAYTAGTDLNDRRIYLKLRSGGDPIVVTRDVTGALAPQWSPDGTTIAFMRHERGKPCKIMLIAVPVGTSRQVGQCRSSAFSWPVWDQTGSALYFSDSESSDFSNSEPSDMPQHIFRLDLDSGTVTELKRNAPAAASDIPLSISHDNKTMLIVRSFGNSFAEVVLRSMPDGHERVFLKSVDFDINAALSEDANTVFVAQTKPWESSLWAYPVSGGPPQRILTGATLLDTLAAGPDGLLAFNLEYGTTQIAAMVASPDKAADILDASAPELNFPDYAPDGTLAGLDWRQGGLGIWITEPGKPAYELRRVPGCACDLRWSPNGDRIAYAVSIGPQYEVFVVSRAGTPMAHFDSPLPVGAVDWTADGNGVLTTRQEEKGWRIWRTDLSDPDKSFPVSAYGWSAVRMRDGHMFAMKSVTGEVWRMDGTPRRLTPPLYDSDATTWAVTKDRVLYADYSDAAHPRIMAVSFDGGTPTVAGYAPDLQHGSYLAGNPITGRIIYSRLVSESADIGWIRVAQK